MTAYLYRVTKYDSGYRDMLGTYLRDEWTSRRDIGREIDGHVLTEDEFEATVNKYLYALEACAHESGVSRLAVVGLYEDWADAPPWDTMRNGTVVSLDEAVELVRHMLRGGTQTPALEEGDRFYVHVGDNMYMWIGSHAPCV